MELALEKNELENNSNINNILSQKDKSGELEIISEEKNINGSEENTNNKGFKKSGTSNKANTEKEKENKMLNYSPKFLFENEDNLLPEEKNENDNGDLMNYLSDDNEKKEIRTYTNLNEININKNKLSKSYNEIKDEQLNKENMDNNNNYKIELPLSNRLNLSMKLKEDKEKDRNKALSSKKGALKILELLTSKKKEKEEIEKKKEELIETFNKARNDTDRTLHIKNFEENKENIQSNNNNIITFDKNEINNNDNIEKEINDKINLDENINNRRE